MQGLTVGSVFILHTQMKTFTQMSDYYSHHTYYTDNALNSYAIVLIISKENITVIHFAQYIYLNYTGILSRSTSRIIGAPQLFILIAETL